MKRISCIALLSAILCTSILTAPEAQALGVNSSRTENHHPLIRIAGWFGELPIWKFLPQGYLYSTKDLEAIFGPSYSESPLAYEYLCNGNNYDFATNEYASKLAKGKTYWDADNSKEYVEQLYSDNPDWNCTLGRSQYPYERALAALKVVSSSVIHTEN